MSGPKTSTLEIERRTQQRMAHAREKAQQAAVDLQRALDALFAEERAWAEQTDALESERRAIESAFQAARLEMSVIVRHAMDGPTVSSLEISAAEAERAVGRLIAATEKRLEQPIEHVRDHRANRSLRDEALSIAQAMSDNGADELSRSIARAAEALAATTREGAAERVSTQTAAQAQAEPQAQASERASRGQSAPSAQPVEERLLVTLSRMRDFSRSPHTLERDRTLLAGLARAIASLTHENGLDAAPAETVVAQFAAVEGGIDTRIARMRDLHARIATLEATLGPAAPARPAAFADEDAAIAHFDLLKAAADAAAEKRYIRTCVDAIMRAHGYDVARSVTMARAAQGEHLLFASAGKNNGVHAFMSEQGDMMMEVVGIGSTRPGRDGFAHIEAVESADEQADLLAAQTEFCSVYAEIEAELAACGIVSAARCKAAPNVRHCKKMSLESSKAAASPAAKRSKSEEAARKNAGGSKASKGGSTGAKANTGKTAPTTKTKAAANAATRAEERRRERGRAANRTREMR